MKTLTNLPACEARKFLDSFDVIVSDLNGVLFYVDPIPGAKEGIHKLQSIGKKIFYTSNNSTLNDEQYKKFFEKLSIDLKDNDLIHPSKTVIDYLKSIKFDKSLFCITSSPSMSIISDAGIKCIPEDNAEVKTPEEFMMKIADEPTAGAVYVDVDPNMNFVKICKALSILQRPETLLLIGARDKLIPISPQKSLLGHEAFQNILMEKSNKQPIMLGKPSEYLKSMIMKQFNITNPKRVLLIGDTLEQDMAFGSMCGFQKLLVFTGVAKPDDINRNTGCYMLPDYCIDSLGDIVKVVEKSEKYRCE